MTTKKILLREFVAMDAGYKTPWIAKKTLDDGKIPVMPYTRYKGKKGGYHPWDYKYDPAKDIFVCPHGQELRHATTDRDGKRAYRSTPKNCVNCPSKAYCGANEKGQKLFTTHIWIFVHFPTTYRRTPAMGSVLSV